MIKKSVHQLCFGKQRLPLLVVAACTVFGTGCTPDPASGTASTLAGDLMRQLVAWWML